jgi:hypothetical protein
VAGQTPGRQIPAAVELLTGQKLAAARRNNSPSLHKITEWPVRKDAVTFFVGGDGAAAGEEIKKILRFQHE